MNGHGSQVAKKVFRQSVSWLRLPQALLSLQRGSAIILYHGVTDRADAPDIQNYRGKHLHVPAFRRQIEFLKRHFRVVPMDEFMSNLHAHRPIHRLVTITFDDGYQNNFRVAWPILKEMGVPCTVFVATDFVEKSEPLWVDRLEFSIGRSKALSVTITRAGMDRQFPLRTREEKIRADLELRSCLKRVPDSVRRELLDRITEQAGVDIHSWPKIESDYAPLSWAELREMVDSGLVGVGAHTTTHAILTRLDPRDARVELNTSKRIIEERLTRPCRFFAYPNGQPGDFDDMTTALVREAGFEGAFTTVMGFVNSGSDPYVLRRITMDGTDNWEAFLVTISGIRTLPRRLRSGLA